MKSLKLTFAVLAVSSLCSFTFSNGEDDKLPKTDATEVATNQVKFRIQLGAFDGEAPAEMLALFDQIGGVTKINSKGKTAYLTAPFSTEDAANNELPLLRDKGFKEAKNVVVIENYVITARTYHFFYDNKNVPASEKDKLFVTEQRVIRD